MCNSLHIMNHCYITGQTVKLTGGFLHAKISLVSAHKACRSSTNRLPLRVPSGFHRSEPLVQGVTTFSRQYINGLFLLHVKHTRLTGLHGSNPGICLSTFFLLEEINKTREWRPAGLHMQSTLPARLPRAPPTIGMKQL